MISDNGSLATFANNIENMNLENLVFTMLSFNWLSYGLTGFFNINVFEQTFQQQILLSAFQLLS